MNSRVALSSTAHRVARTDLAPAPRKARAIPMTPSARISPVALWQQLRTTSLARTFAFCTSAIVRTTSSSSSSGLRFSGGGANAISPVKEFPCAAIWTRAAVSRFSRKRAFVASSPNRGLTPNNLAISWASSFACSSLVMNSVIFFALKDTKPTSGSPTITAPFWLWKLGGHSKIAFIIVKDGNNLIRCCAPRLWLFSFRSAAQGILWSSASGTIMRSVVAWSGNVRENNTS